MHVDLLAHTMLNPSVMRYAYGYEVFRDDHDYTEDADALAEAAGRLCYKAFGRKRPATATNDGYLANIVAQQHFSVLEHASATFLVRDVSRALLAELSRHRHLSFSVVSQRYVDYGDSSPVIPPALRDTDGEHLVRVAYEEAVEAYEELTERLIASGASRKEAREAARSVLPNAAPVDMVVSGNMRAWRDVLGKRWHVAADAEIREMAGMVLESLRDIAPNSFADIPTTPYGSDA